MSTMDPSNLQTITQNYHFSFQLISNAIAICYSIPKPWLPRWVDKIC